METTNSQLERRWAAEAQARLQRLEGLVRQHAALLAAVHYSRSVAWRWGWAPWRELMAQARQQVAAAEALHRRCRMASALAAWLRCRQAATWRVLAADACAAAVARQHRHHTLARHALAALQNEVRWAKGLPQQHTAWVAAAAIRSWRQLAAMARHRTRQQLASAQCHDAARTCRRALEAWRQGAGRCRQERLVERRREQRWGQVQQYLAEHRESKKRQQGTAGGSAPPPPPPAGSSLSSAENSLDPNTSFGLR